ncbi:rCG30284 [Rattus norvegicus]|uniref:RCG30284 n=1 Tax=Rattus norvegicus TaxID=10116 RepID=A6IMG8_RAT|nr:rCG30284 [Rattus norvegicus]
MRNKIKQKNEINLFRLLKVSHLLIYILVFFFKFKHQNPREKEKKKKKDPVIRPSPHSRISIDPCMSKIRN